MKSFNLKNAKKISKEDQKSIIAGSDFSDCMGQCLQFQGQPVHVCVAYCSNQ